MCACAHTHSCMDCQDFAWSKAVGLHDTLTTTHLVKPPSHHVWLQTHPVYLRHRLCFMKSKIFNWCASPCKLIRHYLRAAAAKGEVLNSGIYSRLCFSFTFAY